MSIKVPFEAKLLLLACFALILFGCGSGETTEPSSGATLNLEEALLSEYPIAYITRPAPVSTDTNLLVLDTFNPDATLFIRATASPTSPEVNITDSLFEANARYDVRDINISHDGELMVFAARGPFDETIDPEADEEQPSVWNLYEYSFITGEVYPIMNEDDAGLGHDITPYYLADGRIVFSSSRQQRAGTIMLDEGKPQYSYQVEVDEEDPRFGPGYAIHLAEFDSNRNLVLVEQVTFNQSHDFDPVLLDNGKVVFSRWDAAGDLDQVSFYQMNPDGSELEILFGYRSHDQVIEGQTLQFTNPQVSPNAGELIAILTPYESQGVADSIVSLDIANFVDVGVQVQGSDASGNGIVDIIPFELLPDAEAEEGEFASNGRYSSISPLFDGTNRAIVSWSFCRVLNENGETISCNGLTELEEGWTEAPPNYGLWLFDYDNDTQTPLILGGGSQPAYYEVVVAQPKTAPTSIPDIVTRFASDTDVTCDPGFFDRDDGFGIIHIRSVFDLDGVINENWVPEGVTSIAQLADPVAYAAADRDVRFVRFEKPVYMPDPDLKDLDGNRANFGPFMREILGYAPVHPDGSIKVKIPADIPFMMTFVDQYGQRVTDMGDHMSWMQVRPGEELECNGCHDAESTTPHGRVAARPASINAGAASMTMFPNTNPNAYEADISAAGDGSITQTCFPNAGETMAELFVRVDSSRADLTSDIVFRDIWTDTDQRAADETTILRYGSLNTIYETGVDNGDAQLGALPFNKGECLDEWDAFCRIVINYEDHIQPLWEVTRTVTTADGPELLSCVGCHSNANTDPDDGSPLPPAGELDLVADIVNDRATSFRDLTGNNFAFIDYGGATIEADNLDAQDTEDELIPELVKRGSTYCYDLDGRFITPTIVVLQEAVMVPVMEPVLDPDTGEPVLDDDGNVVMTEARDDDGNIILTEQLDADGNVVRTDVLDDDGDPIPDSFTIRESNLGYNVRLLRGISSDNVGSRSTASRVRDLFQPGFEYSFTQCGEAAPDPARPIDFDHSQAGLFSDAELKLLLEWVGIGSAYYNNPFAVPD